MTACLFLGMCIGIAGTLLFVIGMMIYAACNMGA